MREIKCRGKRTDGVGWVYGYYVRLRRQHYIFTEDGASFEVAPETVGQFTGLPDKDEKEYCEDDVFRINEKLYRVVFRDGCFWGVSPSNTHYVFYLYDCGDGEIIGNICENPELKG